MKGESGITCFFACVDCAGEFALEEHKGVNRERGFSGNHDYHCLRQIRQKGLTKSKGDICMEAIVIAHDLEKKYKISRKQQRLDQSKSREKIALSGLSFTANRGEIYALLGPNGAGKTTSLRILSALIKADRGDCSINGSSVSKEPEAVRAQIGFLTSELKLEDYFTPNYLFDFFSELNHVPAKIRDERKNKLFERFGISRFAESKVADLSTGMKQKVSIAISLVHDPEIIIFDEPTNGLDVITARTVMDFLREEKARGKTIIISTHIFDLVEKLADRVGFIMKGRLVREGTLESLTREKSLEEVFFEIYLNEVGDET